VHIAVVGAGINGVCIAWELAKVGHEVVIFERDTAISHTSRSSSKLLHGGLRYLENGEFRLVREALLERQAWLRDAPSDLAKPLRMVLPVYRSGRRSRWMLKTGLFIYDALACSGNANLPSHQWLSQKQVLAQYPALKNEGLVGAFEFWDVQMDDQKLGLWAVQLAHEVGVVIHERVGVASVDVSGKIDLLDGVSHRFDRVINAAGPWAKTLLDQSKVPSAYDLDWVRGSHIVLNRKTDAAYLLEVPSERRIFFVLPWKEGTLVGTTEVRQYSPESVVAGKDEVSYLLQAYNAHFKCSVNEGDIREVFSGVRPLVKSAQDPSRATREYALEKKQNLISIFGGKWTTARALARRVRELVETA
jgi:glycerol-3-phosphate dehydrogenase